MNRLKEFRQKAGMTQQELGDAVGGWFQTRVYNYEKGRTPKLEDCRRIVEALNANGAECTIDDVFPSDREAA